MIRLTDLTTGDGKPFHECTEFYSVEPHLPDPALKQFPQLELAPVDGWRVRRNDGKTAADYFSTPQAARLKYLESTALTSPRREAVERLNNPPKPAEPAISKAVAKTS